MKFDFFVILLTILLVYLTCSSSQIVYTKDAKYQMFIQNNKYARALNLSLLFIEAQRSGKLPKDNRIPWRGDSLLLDRGMDGEDLTGGYYSGTTEAKFIWPMAFTATVLAWGVITWEEAYVAAGQLKYVHDAIKWATDYFIKCHVKPEILYYHVGPFWRDIHADSGWLRFEDMDEKNRTAVQINRTKPASDVAAEVAAAFAAASIVFKDVNPRYAAKCLEHAKQLYHFAYTYRGSLVASFRTRNLWEFYQYGLDLEYFDELIWGALWIYKASNQTDYLDMAVDLYYKYTPQYNYFYLDNKVIGIELLLAESKKSYTYLYTYVTKLLKSGKITPKGLIYPEEEFLCPLACASNAAFMYLLLNNFMQSRKIDTNIYGKFNVLAAQLQIDYILGSQGMNFVVGYDENSPMRPYHMASSCPDRPKPCEWEHYETPAPNPQTLYGALVYGPSKYDVYFDNRIDYPSNTVALFINAGFTSALAGLLYEEMKNWHMEYYYSASITDRY